MIYKIKWNMFIEISIRITCWLLFLWLDASEPFIREIHENEIWKYQNPVTPSYVPGMLLWSIIFIVPSVCCLIEYAITEKKDEPMLCFLGITLSYALNGFITTYVKVMVGRPRPDFYFRCFPDGKGDDYKNCVGEKKSWMDGRKSFPSGHSAFSFACMTFLALYWARKFNLYRDNKKGESWQLCVCTLPLIVAAGIAISRTCDYHHHYEDVAVGSILGAVISYFCYNLYFPKAISGTNSG